jgi:hypothetical protein
MWSNQWRVLLGGAPEHGQGWDSGAGPNAVKTGQADTKLFMCLLYLSACVFCVWLPLIVEADVTCNGCH